MARSASTFSGNGDYTREIVAGKISNAYNIPLNQGAAYVLNFSLDLAGSATVGDGSAGTIEFYVRFPQGAIDNPHALVVRSGFSGSGNGQGGNALWLQTGSILRWQVDPFGEPAVLDWSPNLINPVVANTFYHLVIQTSGNGTWYFWADGVYKGSASDTIDGSDFNFAFPTIHFGKSGNASNQYGALRFDEIRISSIERYTAGNNFTPPTVAFVNDDDTLALFHCDSDSEVDDTSIQHNAASALSVTATQSATGLLVDPTEYVHTLYWNGDYIVEVANIFAASALTVTTTQVANGGISKDSASALSVTATQAVSGGLRKDGSSGLSVTATQVANGGFRKDGASALSVTATQATSGTILKNGQSALAVTATQAATGDVTITAASALAVTATLSATAITSDFANAAMSVTATISAAASIIRNGVATLNSTATLSASAQDFDIATANLASAFTLTATAQKVIVGSAAMQSSFTMTTVAEMLQAANVERTIAVKAETRIIKALQDQRIIAVNSESRINIVLADSRTILVPDETRILKEP